MATSLPGLAAVRSRTPSTRSPLLYGNHGVHKRKVALESTSGPSFNPKTRAGVCTFGFDLKGRPRVWTFEFALKGRPGVQIFGIALKGRRIPAQGNALGLVWPPPCVLKERRNRGDRAHACHSKIGGVPSERVHMSACFPERCSGLACDVPLGHRQSVWRSPPKRLRFLRRNMDAFPMLHTRKQRALSTTSPHNAYLRFKQAPKSLKFGANC
jgi:hypothetical protein